MKSNTSETFIVERHYIADKEAEVIRTRTSGKVYHFRMWVAKEKCYVRKSLRTKDLHIALELAKKEFYKTIGIIESGKTVKDITVGDLVKKFLEDKEKEATNILQRDALQALLTCSSCGYTMCSHVIW